jgi:hypothetical protein
LDLEFTKEKSATGVYVFPGSTAVLSRTQVRGFGKGVIGHIGPEEVTILGGAGFPEASLQLQQLVVHGAIVAEIGIP